MKQWLTKRELSWIEFYLEARVSSIHVTLREEKLLNILYFRELKNIDEILTKVRHHPHF